jgi:hypothetical protein
MYGGRIALVKRFRFPSASTLLSLTRGAAFSIVPEPSVTRRGWARPLRTTRARPSSSRSLRWRSRYASTSASSAAANIRRAPSRARSSRPSVSPSACPATPSLTTFHIGGVSFPPVCKPGVCVMGVHAEGYAAFFIPSTHDPQLSSIPLGRPRAARRAAGPGQSDRHQQSRLCFPVSSRRAGRRPPPDARSASGDRAATQAWVPSSKATCTLPRIVPKNSRSATLGGHDGASEDASAFLSDRGDGGCLMHVESYILGGAFHEGRSWIGSTVG